MSTVYFWHQGKVVTIDSRPLSTEDFYDNKTLKALLSCCCVDAFCMGEELRYGMFVKLPNKSGRVEWQHQLLHTFPPEFRTHLLLMGVA